MSLPVFAAVGAAGYPSITSWLAAAEPTPPYGYYPPKVSPAPPGLVPGGPQSAPPSTVPGQTVNGQTVNWNTPKGNKASNNWNLPTEQKLTTPAVSGPSVAATPPQTAAPIQQTAGSEPPTMIPPPKVGFDPLSLPMVGNDPQAMPKIGAEPLVTPPLTTPPIVTPPTTTPPISSLPTTAPAPSAVGVPLSPPKLLVESSMPESPTEATPPSTGPSMLKPIQPPAPPRLSTFPVPTIPSDPPSPTTTPTSPSVSTGTAPTPPSATVPKSTSTSHFPTTELSAKSSPAVVIEALAPATVSVNQPLTYELVVRNTGVGPVGNVRVDDELPAGAKYLASEPEAEQVSGRLIWQLGAMEAGAEKRIKISVKLADEGEVRSRAMVSFTAAAEAKIKVTRPKIVLGLTAGETVRVGDEVAIQIRVENTGTGPAGSMQLQANLSEGLNHSQGSVIETELTDLPAGESRTLTLRTLATKAGAQTCTLSVAADGNPPEISKVQIAIVEPMLNAKLSGPSKCLVRSDADFKIEIANPGTAATDPVQTAASIPEGFEFVSASDSGTLNPANRTVVWKLGSLSVGEKKELAMKLRATAIAEGSVKLLAQTIVPDGTENGVTPVAARVGRPLESKAESNIKAEGVPALRFEVIDVEDPVEVGKEAIYEIKVQNQGTAPCTNVQISATLADGTTATGATGPTQARGQGQLVTFDSLASLDVKGEAKFKIKVKGGVAGDQRFKVQVVCDQIRTPVLKEENTRFYKK